MRGEGAGETRGGARRLWRHISAKPWGKYCGYQRGCRGVRLTHSRGRVGGGGQQGQASGDLEILGRRRVTHRWVEDPVRRLEILGQVWATPRWEENTVEVRVHNKLRG